MPELVEFYFNVKTKIHDADPWWDSDEEESFSWSELLKLAKGGEQQTKIKEFEVDTEVLLRLHLTFVVLIDGRVTTTVRWEFYEGDKNGKELKSTEITEPHSVARGVKAVITSIQKNGDDEGDWFNLDVEVVNETPPPVPTSEIKEKVYQRSSITVPSSTSEPVLDVSGTIYKKWKQNSWLGYPISIESSCPDGIGKFAHFSNGSVFQVPGNGTFEVHGSIREKWAETGWETGVLGYPLTDELDTPLGNGRLTNFQGGSIIWSGNTGAHVVKEDIRNRWMQMAFKDVGFPEEDEVEGTDTSIRQKFQKGEFVRQGNNLEFKARSIAPIITSHHTIVIPG